MENKKEKEENKEELFQGFMKRVFNNPNTDEYIAEAMKMGSDEDSFAVDKALANLQK